MAKSLSPQSPSPPSQAPSARSSQAALPVRQGGEHGGGRSRFFHLTTFLGSLAFLMLLTGGVIGWLMVSLPDLPSSGSPQSSLMSTMDAPLITSAIVAEMDLPKQDKGHTEPTAENEGVHEPAQTHEELRNSAAAHGEHIADQPDTDPDAANGAPDQTTESHAPDMASLAPVSDPDDHDFYEQTKLGELPIRRAKDGQSVFDRYKIATHPAAGAKGVISLAITDFGLSAHDIATLNDSGLSHISVIFSPYTKDLQKKIDTVRGIQIEPWINAPIEDENFGENDSGPYSLISGLNDDQNALRLMAVLAAAKHVPGVVFLNPPNFAAVPDALAAIIGQMDRRGVALVSAAAATDDLSAQAAQKFPNLVFLHGATWIDAGQSPDQFADDLKGIETMALSTGSAMVVIPMQPAALNTLQQWKKDLTARGIELAPLSALKTYGGH